MTFFLFNDILILENDGDTMNYDVKDAKGNVLLAFAILLLLFTICIVVYTNGWFKSMDEDMDVTTNISFDGGVDSLSKELQYIIPYVNVSDPVYVTAYQDDETAIDDIHNDILLTKGYFNNMESNSFSSGLLLSKISDLYGSDFIIVNKSFNVNGKNSCVYEDQSYKCETLEYKGKLYKADRKIENINITNNEIKLTENILFYSEEKVMDMTYYNVYNNGLYETIVLSFTSNDVARENITLEEYIEKNLNNRRIGYQSSFVINNNKYNWIGTVIL